MVKHGNIIQYKYYSNEIALKFIEYYIYIHGNFFYMIPNTIIADNIDELLLKNGSLDGSIEFITLNLIHINMVFLD